MGVMGAMRATHDKPLPGMHGITRYRAFGGSENPRMPPDRRTSPRESLELPVTLGDGSPAVTRNISAFGLYLTTASGVQLDQWLSLEYELPEVGLRFTAAGEVMRIETTNGDVGVAIRLHSPNIEPVG
jgi:hypothetical protein